MSRPRQWLHITLGLLSILLAGRGLAQVPPADLALTMTATPTPIFTGSEVIYSIKLENVGGEAAANVVVTDNLPDGVTFVSCEATDGGVCNGIGNSRTVTFASVPSGATPTITLVATVIPNCAFTGDFSISNTAAVSTTPPDAVLDNNSDTAIVIASNPPPAIGLLTPTPDSLWPPNHKMADVLVDYTVTDSCGPVTCAPLAVTSNEPVNGIGDGNTSPDWVEFDDHHLQLRAERAGGGTGRIYTVTATCTDDLNLTSSRSTSVWVPHDNSMQPSLFSAVLPAGRAARVGMPVTVFATIINGGTFVGTACSISLPGNVPATLSYQTTNPVTNAVTGSPNTPVDIAPGASQSFVVSLTPAATVDPSDIQLNFSCANAKPARFLPGINTLLLSAWSTPTPDVVALVATTSGDGISNIPGPWGTGIFAVATSNVGSAGSLTATADTGPTKLPLDITLCQTNPATGNCLQQPATAIPLTSSGGDTSTFAVFVRGTGKSIAFDPAGNRVHVRIRNNANGAMVGATSVAVQTR